MFHIKMLKKLIKFGKNSYRLVNQQKKRDWEDLCYELVSWLVLLFSP